MESETYYDIWNNFLNNAKCQVLRCLLMYIVVTLIWIVGGTET